MKEMPAVYTILDILLIFNILSIDFSTQPSASLEMTRYRGLIEMTRYRGLARNDKIQRPH